MDDRMAQGNVTPEGVSIVAYATTTDEGVFIGRLDRLFQYIVAKAKYNK